MMRLIVNTIRRRNLFCGALLVGLALSSWGTAAAADEKSAPMVLAPMPAARVQSLVTEWIGQQPTLNAEVRSTVLETWKSLPETFTTRDLLNHTMSTFGKIDPSTDKLLELARQATVINADELFASLESPGVKHPFYQSNLRAVIAEILTQRRLYEESLDVIKPIDPAMVIDPASFLFYRAVCEHALLQQEPGLKTLEQLLKHTEGVPVRFQVLANLMQEDLQQLKPKTLYEVARQMNDVERRLDLGRSGKKVQKVEDDIIATLDELIKKLEEQQQGGGGGGAGQGGAQNQSSNPAQDSTIKGSTAPGNIDPKAKKNTGTWGELPPKKEADAKNRINRDFPAHYRQAIDEYFKKLSRHKVPSGK
ncbi:MAG: hypothetical protein ACKVT0_15135 [Planctomycetaceae bacterium]